MLSTAKTSLLRSLPAVGRRHLTKTPKGGTVIKWYKSLLSRRNTSYGSEPTSHIIQIGDPLLRRPCLPLKQSDIQTEDFKKIVEHMKAVMVRYDAIGLSTVQLGLPGQVFAIHFSQKQLNMWDAQVIEERQMKVEPFQVFVNPTVRVLDNTPIVAREGCASFHGFSALVSRPTMIQIQARDENGQMVEKVFSHWSARIVLHEMDHLQGKMFTDIMDRESLMFNYWRSVNNRRGNFRLSFNGITTSWKWKWISLFERETGRE